MTAALFGLAGFEILIAADVGGELELLVQTTAALVGVQRVVRGRAGEGPPPDVGAGSPLAGRAVVVCWVKRIWSYPLCERRTWTEQHPAIAPRAGMTERAHVWAFEQVAISDAAVARAATGLGVAW